MYSIDFEDTYDGLGDQLDEANDDFNNDTFGGGQEEVDDHGQVGKDFDFFGHTAQVSSAIGEEQIRYHLQHQSASSRSTTTAQPAQQRPKKTGYEKYQDPGYIPEIAAKSSVWGTSSRQQGVSDTALPQLISTARASAAPSKKMMSLEEVEAAMLTQGHTLLASEPVHPPDQPPYFYHVRQPQQLPSVPSHDLPQLSAQQPTHRQAPTTPQFHAAPRHQRGPSQPSVGHVPPQQPLQILQNPNRARHSPRPSQEIVQALHEAPSPTPPHSAQTLPVITHPQQLMELSEEQRRAYLVEDAKRAKRNHKIFVLSKGNGLMTPQDKNFITRIQLQQLVTATGNSGDPGPESALAEDFYYQVYSQIRGAPRQHPTQPLGHFAQTYLFQTGGRMGYNRRNALNGDNHMQRMQQQVQRAVEAAKLKPKNKQLIIEGSLGKISFSNAKTPKPLLNLKRTDSHDHRPASARKGHQDVGATDRKSILRNVEAVYSTLMRMEDHERHTPAPSAEDDVESEQAQVKWREKMQVLNATLWRNLKVLEPIVPGSAVRHPFIAFLSFPKGKKAIPRVFRHMDQEQRVTILTMIVVHLDQLDVIRLAQIPLGETQPPPLIREEIELFSHAVMPSLLGYVSEAPLNIIIGLLGLIIDHTNVLLVSRTKVGLGLLTMLLSRAELVKEAGAVSDQDWHQWTLLYDRLFDTLEPMLGGVFPGPVNSGDDMYIWQFLAAVGIGASPEQQQRLVIAVK